MGSSHKRGKSRSAGGGPETRERDMRSCYTPEQQLNDAVMLWSSKRQATIFVEGITDKKFFEVHIDREIRSHICFQAVNAEETHWKAVYDLIELARKSNFKPIFGVLDRDYHIILQDGICENSHLVFTDQSDMEMMLFFSSAFDKLLQTYGSAEKLKNYSNPRQPIIDTACPLGVLRCVSYREQYNLWFKRIEYSKIMKGSEWKTDLEEMIRHVLARTRTQRRQERNVYPSEQMLKDNIHQLLHADKAAKPEDYCNGHDVLGILALFMKKEYASDPDGANTHDTIFRALLMAYPNVSATEAPLTRVDKKILFWEKTVQSWVKAEERVSGT